MKKIIISFLFFLILVLGIGVRMYYINLSPYNLDCDTATVGLMAKHIIEGNIPMFFYGQEYLGPFEAFVMAGSFKIFGISTYSMFYGQLLFSLLFLLSTYFLAKKLSGIRGGLIAMLYCALSPFYLIVHNILPYGYHVELLLFGNITFILAYKIIEVAQAWKRVLYYVILGLTAGLGFWTQYLMMYYLIPIAIFLLINARWKYLFSCGLLSIFCFFMGGLPFWVYTVQHRFGTFGFPPSTKAGFMPAIYKFFSQDCVKLLGLRPPVFSADHIFDAIVVVLYVSMCLYFVAATLLNRCNQGFRIHKNYLIILFALSMLIFYGSFNFFSVRGCAYYILPIFSIIPVVLSYPFKKMNIFSLTLFSVVFILIVTFNVKDIYSGMKNEKKDLETRSIQWNNYIDFLEREGITKVLGGDASDFTTCFVTKEKVIASPYGGSEYKPHSETVEYADNIAITEIGPGFKANMDMLCKSYTYGQGVFYNILLYQYKTKAIPPHKWRAKSNYFTNDAAKAFDRDCDAWWSTKTPRTTGMLYDIDLREVYKICRFIIGNAEHYCNLPVSCKVEVSVDGSLWKEVMYVPAPEPLFWSGPRLYWHQVHGRWEVMFKPCDARYIRLTQIGEDYINPWEINEVYIYEYLGNREKHKKNKQWVKEAKRIFDFVQAKKAKFIYADFWLSSKIKKWGNGDIGTLSPYYINFPNDGIQDRMVALTPDTIFIVSSVDSNEFDRVAKEFLLPFGKKIFGDFVCYFFENGFRGSYLEYLQGERWLYWTGVGIVKRELKNYSSFLARYAFSLKENGDIAGAKNYYKKALKYYPNNTVAHKQMLELYRNIKDKYLDEKKIYKHKFVPSNEKRVKFQNGAEFVGYTINKNNLKKGGKFRLDLFWMPKKEISVDEIVFVHFIKDKKPVVQADHPFLHKFLRPLKPLEGEIFKETLFMGVPDSADVEAGEYSIVIGFWNPNTKKRVPIEGLKRETKLVIGTVRIVD